MAHPITHAESSAKRFGGKPEDYLPIHDFLDSSKSVFPDNRHRALTHNSWFIFVVEKVFGHSITIQTDLDCDNCHGTAALDGFGGEQEKFADFYCICNGTGKKPKKVPVRYICEQHILEDFGGKYIPTASDYLEGLEWQDWMNNGIRGAPTSHRKLEKKPELTKKRSITLD